jgi:hypothetical protein
MFTIVYTNKPGETPAAIQLDCAVHYTAADLPDGDQQQQALFLYLCGINYTTPHHTRGAAE